MECIERGPLNAMSILRDATMSWQVYCSGSMETVLSVKLFGCAVLGTAASSNTGGPVMGPSQTGMFGTGTALVYKIPRHGIHSIAAETFHSNPRMSTS